MDPVSSPSFAQLLKRSRLAAGLTQEALAERANLSVRAVSDLERGLKTRPHRDTVELLAEALGLPPEERVRLQASVPRGRPPLSPADPTLIPPSTLPPTALTPLIGREREEAQVVSMLHREGTRLLTLTGTGGVGKTRLALQVAATVQGDFADGLVVVPLSSIHDPSLVLSSLARSLGVREAGDVPLLTGVIAHLREKQTLLLLDNFEQVVDAAPLLLELLSRCPKLSLLVTSRVPLHLRGEQELEVPPLAVPDPASVQSTDDMFLYPAVALFLHHARAVKPDFQVSDHDAGVLVEICRRLDGLPLAIELAAARVKVLPLPALLARLEHRLQILTGGPRDLPERQQTMRNTIAWSYDLLDEGEQQLFRRLAVFVGGCTLAAAEAVCNADGSLPFEVLDGLASLVDKGLLGAQEEQEPRFLMLETIREYAAERLEETKRAEQVRAKHAAYYLALAEEAEPKLSGPELADWLRRLQPETDNFRAALSWFLEPTEQAPPRAEEAVRLARALWQVWYEQGQWSEARRWLMRALAAGPAVSASVRGRALSTAGIAILFQGDFTQAATLLTESLELFRTLGSVHGMAICLTFLGYVAAFTLDRERVDQLLTEATALRPQLTHPVPTAYLVSFLGVGHASQGDFQPAARFLEESLELFRALGHSRGIRQCLVFLGHVDLFRGEPARARALFREGLELSRHSQDVLDIQSCLFGLGCVAALEEQWARAARLWGAAEQLRQERGLILLPLARTGTRYEALVAAARDQLGEAASGAAWEEGRTLPLGRAISYALEETLESARGSSSA